MSSEAAVYRKTVLPNGIRVITEATPHVRSISMGLWIDVGSRDETDLDSGVSHFIEHVVFKGTKNRNASETASYLESVGGVINAFTSREQTCYFAKILDQHLPMAVELLFDLINNALFESESIEREKRVILEEIKDVEDSPGDLVHDKFAGIIFGKHPLGRSILGTRTTIKNMGRAALLRHIRKFYRPDRMMVIASGNLTHEQLVELVEQHSAPLPVKPSPNGRQKPAFKTSRRIFPRKTAQTHVCLGIPVREYKEPGRTAALLMNALLGGGMSSRFFQHLREQLGLVYTVFSYLDYFEDSGIMGIYLGTDKRNVKRAIAAVMTEMESLKNDKLAPADLARIKDQLKGNLMLGLESTSNRMNRLAKHELLLGRFIDLDETVAGIDSVTPDEIVELAREYFVKEKFSASTLGPASDGIYSIFE